MEAGMRIRALFARWDSTLMVRTPAGPSPVFEALEPRLLLSAVRADEAWTAGLAFLGTTESTAKADLKAVAAQTVDMRAITAGNGRVLAYVIDEAPQGFVIVSGDTDVRPILGYSAAGTFPFEESPDNVLLHLVQWDVEARLKNAGLADAYDQADAASNHASWTGYLSGVMQALPLPVAGTTQWGPWITFPTWNQTNPYNKFLPLDPTGARSVAGCTATALAQILYYFRYPSSVSLSYGSYHYTSQGSSGAVRIDEDAALRDFPTFAQLNAALASISYNLNSDEMAYLTFAAGIATRTGYAHNVSSAWADAQTYLTAFHYASAKDGSWGAAQSAVINDMKLGDPVQLSIADAQGDGHYVVLDGYKSTGEFHVNLGWGGFSDAWYFLPNIDTTQHGGSYDFTVINGVIYDITPGAGVVPGFNVTAPAAVTATAGDSGWVQWTASNVPAGSSVSLCYDEDGIWGNGNEHWLTVDRPVSSGTAGFWWDTKGVKPGKYYFAGYLNNGNGGVVISQMTASQSTTLLPSFLLTAPSKVTALAGSVVPIQWTATNVSAGSTISLCYDEDGIWGNGNEHWITLSMPISQGAGSFVWHTTGVPRGTYYVAGYMYDWPNNDLTTSQLLSSTVIL
jgi:hypothetical protein